MQYAITQKRIFFQFKSQKEIHTIPFDDINNVIVNHYKLEKKNIGVIFLAVKKPELISFETRNLKGSGKRHQPTLEFIEKVEEVAELIRQGIQNANRLL